MSAATHPHSHIHGSDFHVTVIPVKDGKRTYLNIAVVLPDNAVPDSLTVEVLIFDVKHNYEENDIATRIGPENPVSSPRTPFFYRYDASSYTSDRFILEVSAKYQTRHKMSSIVKLGGFKSSPDSNG